MYKSCLLFNCNHLHLVSIYEYNYNLCAAPPRITCCNLSSCFIYTNKIQMSSLRDITDGLKRPLEEKEVWTLLNLSIESLGTSYRGIVCKIECS